MPVRELKGDAVNPILNDKTVIAHIVNDIGAWGRGFVVPLGEKYPLAKSEYKAGFLRFRLGQNQYVVIEQEKLCIANMFAQRALRSQDNPMPLQYGKLRSCLIGLRGFCEKRNVSAIAMPRIGSGLSGGSWPIILDMIEQVFRDSPVQVDIYVPEGP